MAISEEEVKKMSNDDIRRAVNVSRLAGVVGAVSIITLYLFFVISKQTNDWSWFARSGSLLVIFGVLMTAYDCKARLISSNAPTSYRFQTLFIEVGVIVVGTFIWGFGDLVSLLFS